MGYRLDDKEIKLSGARLSKVGTGKNGDVYKYRNSALKVFKKNQPSPIAQETAEYLTGISTNRILLPKNLLFYNNVFRGYSYKLISKKGIGQRMIMLPKDEFLENIVILEDDIETLSGKQVLLNGVEPSNAIFNGRLFLTDPTHYSILESCPEEELETLNKYQLHLLLTSIITQELRKNNFPSRIERQVKDILELKEPTDDSSDFFDDIIGRNDSIKQFVKKMQ